MPIISALCSTAVLAALLAIPAAGAVIVAAPAANDICSVLGALIASVIALLEARKKDRSLGHTVSVFLGSASVGAFLPGLAAHMAVWMKWISPEFYKGLPWQAWSFSGLICGLNAWWVIHGLNRWLQNRGNKYLGEEDDIFHDYGGTRIVPVPKPDTHPDKKPDA